MSNWDIEAMLQMVVSGTLNPLYKDHHQLDPERIAALDALPVLKDAIFAATIMARTGRTDWLQAFEYISEENKPVVLWEVVAKKISLSSEGDKVLWYLSAVEEAQRFGISIPEKIVKRLAESIPSARSSDNMVAWRTAEEAEKWLASHTE